MKYRVFLENSMNLSEIDKEFLPSGYHVVGHVALLHLKKEVIKYAKPIGDLTIAFDKKIRSVAIRIGPTSGKIRHPQYNLIAGEKKTETIHIENNVYFKLDPLRVTFSGGNKKERIQLFKRVRSGEHILDMFACVGQFALHVAKNADVTVTASEINPVAFDYLEENIVLNKLQKKVEALNCDCREIVLSKKADRIVMGYLHNTIDFLPFALNQLSDEGGVIHMHLSGVNNELQQNRNTINTICRERKFDVERIHIRKIKNYSPGIEHFVFDISLSSLE
jgi:tRNA wybutosine-synthesizing protein 2